MRRWALSILTLIAADAMGTRPLRWVVPSGENPRLCDHPLHTHPLPVEVYYEILAKRSLQPGQAFAGAHRNERRCLDARLTGRRASPLSV